MTKQCRSVDEKIISDVIDAFGVLCRENEYGDPEILRRQLSSQITLNWFELPLYDSKVVKTQLWIKVFELVMESCSAFKAEDNCSICLLQANPDQYREVCRCLFQQ